VFAGALAGRRGRGRRLLQPPVPPPGAGICQWPPHCHGQHLLGSGALDLCALVLRPFRQRLAGDAAALG
ncbi:unnamed protein product, partial [Effrenium voratum]